MSWCNSSQQQVENSQNRRFEIAARATPPRSHGGKQRLDGMPSQGSQPPEAGAKRPAFTPCCPAKLGPPGRRGTSASAMGLAMPGLRWDINHGLLLPILQHCEDDQGRSLLGPTRKGRGQGILAQRAYGHPGGRRDHAPILHAHPLPSLMDARADVGAHPAYAVPGNKRDFTKSRSSGQARKAILKPCQPERRGRARALRAPDTHSPKC